MILFFQCLGKHSKRKNRELCLCGIRIFDSLIVSGDPTKGEANLEGIKRKSVSIRSMYIFANCFGFYRSISNGLRLRGMTGVCPDLPIFITGS